MNQSQSRARVVYVAGHRGMVGAALIRALEDPAIYPRRQDRLIWRSSAELDLRNQQQVEQFFQTEKPDVVVFAAAKVGGIHANREYPADFCYDNLLMAANAIHAAHRQGVERFLYLGSTCAYPRLAAQPMSEDALLTAPLEPTNEAYALAKICGLKLCQYYRTQHGRLFHSAMPTNLYGTGDNYHLENSHVLPALIRRFHLAKESGEHEVAIWGTGQPRRDFLHVDDLAIALLHLLEMDDPPDWVNVGTGTDVSIMELAELIARVVGFRGDIKTDPSMPDGTPVKRTDVSRINATGWRAKIDLESGLRMTYQDFLRESQQGLLRQT